MTERRDDNTMRSVSGWLLVLIMGGFVLKVAKPVLFPFLLAMMFYFVLSPVFESRVVRTVPKTVSIALIMVMFFVIVYLVGILVYSSGKSFVEEFPKYGQKIDELLVEVKDFAVSKGISWDKVTSLKSLDFNKIAEFLLSSLGTFFSFLANMFLILLFLLFMLAGRGKIFIKINASFHEAQAHRLNGIIQKIDRQIQRYLAIKTVICLLTAVLATLVLVIFGVDFAIFLGFLTFLLNYIPNIGSFFATVFPPLVALVQFNNPWRAFWILILLILFNALVANAVEPKLMGRSLGLSPLAVLFSLFFWAWLWGIPGMILSVPLVAVVKIICDNIPSLRFAAALLSK